MCPLCVSSDSRRYLLKCFYQDEGPGEVVALPDGFEPCLFGRKSNCSTNIADGGFDTRKLVDVVHGSLLGWEFFV